MRTLKSILSAVLISGACAAAQADTQFTVVFDDPTGQYSAYYGRIELVALAAGQTWAGQLLNGGTGELSVSIGFADIATAQGHSLASAWLGTNAAGIALYEQGAAHELMTGIDVNGAAADIRITLGVQGYLQNELWFDTDPAGLLGVVPEDRTDALSVMLHEFGHALGFNGWRNGLSGELPGSYQSTFDAMIAPLTGPNGSSLYFQGAAATALYGSAVPLTLGAYAHLGNAGFGPGSDLLPDLMNGVSFQRGLRYEISALDLAIMQDLGFVLTTAVPAPGGLTAGLGGLIAVLLAWRRGLAGAGRGRVDTEAA